MEATQSANVAMRLAQTDNPQIDTNERIIRDVVMASAGDGEREALGHGFWVEREFIEDLVKFTQDLGDEGLMSNFGHNWNNLGKQVGRFRNARIVGNDAVADLHIFESADLSPNLPQMATWLMSMAQEDANAVMCSLRFQVSEFYQYSGTQKVRVWYWDDDDGWVSANPDLGKVYAGFEMARSCDIVDEGAITDSLFTEGLEQRFLDIIHNPQFRPLLETKYKSFTVLNEFYKKKHEQGWFNQFKKLFAMAKDDNNKQDPQIENLQKELDDLEQQLKEKKEALEKEVGKSAEKNKKLEDAQDTINNLTTAVGQLEDRIQKLEDQPTAEETAASAADDPPSKVTDEKPWLNDPINQRAMSRLGKN